MSSRIPLDVIRIASPCRAQWDQMEGDERQRFCGQCRRHVYNISAMTQAEADRLIAAKEGRACVRLYRRPDGTVMTRDCPRGLRAARVRIARMAAAGMAVLGVLAWWTLFGKEANGPRTVVGESASYGQFFRRITNWLQRPAVEQGGMHVMGDICPVSPPGSPSPGSALRSNASGVAPPKKALPDSGLWK